jgi:drug/metabolite transporter (DMT)-like permease
LGAIAFLGESMTLRLVLASAAILAGIALVILKEDKGQRPADVLRRRGNAIGVS